MTFPAYQSSLQQAVPPADLSVCLQSLWWDAKGDWSRAHALVNELDTADAMAVHAYLHRNEGDAWNADYWYRRAGQLHRQASLAAEW
jgi:hypothetical protein